MENFNNLLHKWINVLHVITCNNTLKYKYKYIYVCVCVGCSVESKFGRKPYFFDHFGASDKMLMRK